MEFFFRSVLIANLTINHLIDSNEPKYQNKKETKKYVTACVQDEIKFEIQDNWSMHAGGIMLIVIN